MTGLLRFVVLTPEARLLDIEQVAWVQANLIDGSIGIYPGHAPLLGETSAGFVRYANPSAETSIELAPGLLWVDKNVVTIFCPGVSDVAHSHAENEEICAERLVSRVLAAVQPNQSNVK